jgi:hypothetical protein
VHVCKKPWQEGTERQEVCFISIKQAPPRPVKPQRGVRIGGGYHLTELRGHHKKNANDAEPKLIDKDTDEVIEGISSGQPYFLFAESGDADTFGKGKVPSERMHYRGEGCNDEYHFGTYNRGEARTAYGDKREKIGKKEYTKTVGPDVRECAAYRVLSSERRRAEREAAGTEGKSHNLTHKSEAKEPSESYNDEPASPGGSIEADAQAEVIAVRTKPAGNTSPTRITAAGAAQEDELPLGPAPPSWGASDVQLEQRPEEALDALLSAMGLTRKSTVEEEPGKGKQPSVSCTKCRVADQWAVEMCYISMDDIAERVIEHVVEKEVIVEKFVEKVVQVEVPVVRIVKEEKIVEKIIEKIVEVEKKVEVPVYKYIEPEKPEKPETPGKPGTQTIGTQTDAIVSPWSPVDSSHRLDALVSPVESWYIDTPWRFGDASMVLECHPRRGPGEQPWSGPSAWTTGPMTSRGGPLSGPRKSAAEVNEVPKVRKEKLGAVRVGGGFDVVGSVPETLKTGALNDVEAQDVLSSTKGETMQRMAGVHQTPGQRSIASARARSSIGGGNCKEVYGLVRQMTPDRTKGIHRSHEVLSQDMSKGGGRAPLAPHGHVFGTFLSGSQEKQRFGHNRGSRTAFRVYRSRVTSDDAIDVVPVMSRSQSQPIQRPVSAGPHRLSRAESQERGLSMNQSSQALDNHSQTIQRPASARASRCSRTENQAQGLSRSSHALETTAISTIEAATTASLSGLGLHRSSGSDSA